MSQTGIEFGFDRGKVRRWKSETFINLSKVFSGFSPSFSGEKKLYDKLSGGQNPTTPLIGCCDSRVDPALLLDCDPGDIFVIRNVANLVPPCNETGNQQGVSAAIQFAVEALQAQRIIVMGHEKCGGIRALMQGYKPSRKIDFIGRWMRIVEPVKKEVLSRLSHCSGRCKIMPVVGCDYFVAQ